MRRRLIYVIGPSGAGKDSVLQGLREIWPEDGNTHWARRTITRPNQRGGEQHEALDAKSFEQQRLSHAFAMHWRANHLFYGIRHSEIEPLQSERWVFVNGSREWLPQLVSRWPNATVVHITAKPEILAQRLSSRGRETGDAVAERLARQVPLALPQGSIQIANNGSLQEAVLSLREALQDLGPTPLSNLGKASS